MTYELIDIFCVECLPVRYSVFPITNPEDKEELRRLIKGRKLGKTRTATGEKWKSASNRIMQGRSGMD